jgi:hypothetical protein
MTYINRRCNESSSTEKSQYCYRDIEKGDYCCSGSSGAAVYYIVFYRELSFL